MSKLKNRFEKKLNTQLKKSKVRYEYEADRISYILACEYIPDWTVHLPSGIMYLEAKGYLRPEHKRKMVAVKRQHPEKDIRIIFYSANKKYIKWAERNGFRYAIGEIPREWLV